MDLQRRKFLALCQDIAGALLLGSLFKGSSPSRNRPGHVRIVPLFLSGFELHSAILYHHAVEFANQVYQASGFSILYVPTIIEKDLSSLYQEVRGGPGAMVGSPRYYHSSVPIPGSVLYFGGLPYGLEPAKKADWLRSSQGSYLWDQVYRLGQLKPIYFGQSSANFYHLSKFEMSTPESLIGKSVIWNDQRGMWLKELGAQVYRVGRRTIDKQRSYESVLLSIQGNEVDFTEPLFPSEILKTGVLSLKNIELLLVPNSSLKTSQVFELTHSLQTWGAFSSKQQALINGVAQTFADRVTGEVGRHESTCEVQLLSAQNGLRVSPFGKGLEQRLALNSDALRSHLSSLSSLEQKVYLTYKEFHA